MNIKLRGIEIYHPENKVNNDYFINHFKKFDKNIENMLKAFGKNERYIINNESENTLTMGINAVQKLLKKEKLKGEDIDLIIFSSQFPEYTMPSQALIVHNAINGKREAMCQDLNVNCVGMLVAFDTACRYLMSNDKMKRALVIGSDYTSIHCKEDDENTYPQFGDCACAIILEKTEEDNVGFVDSIYKTESSTWQKVTFPAKGSSKSYNVNDYNRKVDWEPFDGSFIVEHFSNSFDKIISRNDIDAKNISKFCISQYAYPIIQGSAKSLNRPEDDFIYIGNKYGYTGTSSPFIALYEGLNSGDIKQGDTICLWSVGINWTTCAILLTI